MRKIISLFLFCAILFAEQMHTVKDRMGRELSLKSDIKSIVTLGSVPVLNGFLMLFDQGDKIINGLPSFASMPKFKYQLVFAPAIKNKPIMQTKSREPDLEQILKANPDLVLSMNKESIKSLEEKGIKAIYINWRDIKDVTPTIELLASIFLNEARAKAYIKYFNDTVARAKKLTSKVKNKPTVLYAKLSRWMQPVLIAEWWIKTAGGISVTDDGRKSGPKSFSLEDLLKYNPDIILLNNSKDLKELREDKRFSSLKALKNKKVFVVPTGAQTYAHVTVEQPLMILWALNKFYPQKYSEKELFKDTKAFYEEFFNTTLRHEQLYEILKAKNK